MSAPVSEADIARTIDDWLDLGARQGFWVYARILQPNPARPGREGSVSEMRGNVRISRESKGQPDRCVFPTDYEADLQAIAVEIKAAKGVTSPEQKQWLHRFTEHTGQRATLVVHSLDELIAGLVELGVRVPNVQI